MRFFPQINWLFTPQDQEKENIYSPLHWHRSIEIDLAVEGRIDLVVDGKRREMKAGEWEIINSGELHSFNWVERNDSYQGFTLLISKSFLERTFSLIKDAAAIGLKFFGCRSGVYELVINFDKKFSNLNCFYRRKFNLYL